MITWHIHQIFFTKDLTSNYKDRYSNGKTFVISYMGFYICSWNDISRIYFLWIVIRKKFHQSELRTYTKVDFIKEKVPFTLLYSYPKGHVSYCHHLLSHPTQRAMWASFKVLQWNAMLWDIPNSKDSKSFPVFRYLYWGHVSRPP
jgi:hypothetical protein